MTRSALIACSLAGQKLPKLRGWANIITSCGVGYKMEDNCKAIAMDLYVNSFVYSIAAMAYH